MDTAAQRGVTHTYTYDSAGRVSLDAVTIPTGSTGVDDSILSIGTAYDDVGRVQTVTSYANSNGTSPANQVKYAYDGWGNLIEESQAHDGLVATGTPSVQYHYDDGADATTGPTTAWRNTSGSIT